MSVEKEKMVLSLRNIVIPYLRKLNFKGSFPHFTRTITGRINILTFQFDKYGGGFTINIANSKPEGYTTFLGKEIKPNKLTVYDLPIRKRIDSNLSTDKWYRYDRTALKEFINIYDSLSEEVLSNMSIAEEYWEKGDLN